MKKILSVVLLIMVALPVFAQTQDNSSISEPKFKDLDFVDIDFSRDGKTISFRAMARVTSGTVDFVWDFGNGLVKEGKEVNVTFKDYGIKTVSLTGTIHGTEVRKKITKSINVDKPGIKKWNNNFLD